MQYTPHYNLKLPEGTDIVNPLIQDNPNYTTIDDELYKNKLRVVGTATHVKTGTNHAITLADSDINQFKFVATGDYASGDTFTVDGVTVTARVADGSSIPSGAFKINSTVIAALDGTILNLINVDGTANASNVAYNNAGSGLSASNVQDAIDELNDDIVIEYVTNTIAAGTMTPDVVNTYLAPLPAKTGYTAVLSWFVGMNGSLDWSSHIRNIIPHSNGRNLAFIPDGGVGDVIVTFAVMYKKV